MSPQRAWTAGAVIAAGVAAAAATANVGMDAASVHHWAVLVAGSNGYGNYRHQADLCHGYQVLVSHGVPPHQIIAMSYDDVATDPSNPFPGKLFNAPGNPGVDVYAGCNLTYTGPSVTRDNLLAVLTGNSSGTTGGNGTVLKSGPLDTVFLAYYDHGGVGVLGMPMGSLLYADDLMSAFTTMQQKGMYNRLVVYVEACESGSIFLDLPSNVSVYATTAASPSEPSWGTYCPPYDVVDDTPLNTCLGDLYSVNWMDSSDQPRGMSLMLQQQYNQVRAETNESHVQQYGDLTVAGWTVGVFQGNQRPPGKPHVSNPAAHIPMPPRPWPTVAGWDARMASVRSLQTRLADRRLRELHPTLQLQMDEEMALMQRYDTAFATVAWWQGWPSVQAWMEEAAPVRVHHWHCYRTVMAKVEAACGAWGDYTLQYAQVCAHLCTLHGGDPMPILPQVASACTAA